MRQDSRGGFPYFMEYFCFPDCGDDVTAATTIYIHKPVCRSDTIGLKLTIGTYLFLSFFV